MAKGQTLPAAQRGIAFSTVSALLVSVLITMVGAGYHTQRTQYYFSIPHLGPFIQGIIGTGGVVIFSVGFVAASFSSMLTVPLGAALTLDSLFVEENTESSENGEAEAQPQPGKLPRWITFGMMTAMVLISMIVIQTDGKFCGGGIVKRLGLGLGLGTGDGKWEWENGNGKMEMGKWKWENGK